MAAPEDRIPWDGGSELVLRTALATLEIRDGPAGSDVDLPLELITGYRDVDEQHANFLAEVRRMRTFGPDEIPALVAFLRAHTSRHFVIEEQAMLDAGYPGREAHRQEHLRFFDEFVLVKAHLGREGATPENVGRLVERVETWLADHVLREDRRFAEFMRARDDARHKRP